MLKPSAWTEVPEQTEKPEATEQKAAPAQATPDAETMAALARGMMQTGFIDHCTELAIGMIEVLDKRRASPLACVMAASLAYAAIGVDVYKHERGEQLVKHLQSIVEVATQIAEKLANAGEGTGSGQPGH